MDDVSFTSMSMIELETEQIELPRKEVTSSLSDQWKDVIEQSVIDSNLELFGELEIDLPVVGFELVSSDEVIGLCELAWPSNKVALFCNDESEDMAVFEKDGWQCFEDPVDIGLVEKIKMILGA